MCVSVLLEWDLPSPLPGVCVSVLWECIWDLPSLCLVCVSVLYGNGTVEQWGGALPRAVGTPLGQPSCSLRDFDDPNVGDNGLLVPRDDRPPVQHLLDGAEVEVELPPPEDPFIAEFRALRYTIPECGKY